MKMKHIKSLLAIATVALLGSSAEAALTADKTDIEIMVGQSDTVELKSDDLEKTYNLGFGSPTNYSTDNPFTDKDEIVTVQASLMEGVSTTEKSYLTIRGLKVGTLDLEICNTKSQTSNHPTLHIKVTEPQWTAVPLKDVQFVSATYITRTAGTKTVAKREAFATEEGCKYAWGKDDQPLTVWTDESDGTPCDLARPAEATQLLVIGAK